MALCRWVVTQTLQHTHYLKGITMSVPTLYTPSDVAEALNVTPVTVNNWQKRYTDVPKPSFVRTNGAPLWDSLEPWIEWNNVRLEAAEREAKAKAEARLAKAKAELEAAMAALEA